MRPGPPMEAITTLFGAPPVRWTMMMMMIMVLLMFATMAVAVVFVAAMIVRMMIMASDLRRVSAPLRVERRLDIR